MLVQDNDSNPLIQKITSQFLGVVMCMDIHEWIWHGIHDDTKCLILNLILSKIESIKKYECSKYLEINGTLIAWNPAIE